jgi:hypothetical protein
MGGPRHVGSGVRDGPINHIAIEPFELHHQILIKNLFLGHSKVCGSIVGTINSTKIFLDIGLDWIGLGTILYGNQAINNNEDCHFKY